MDKKPSIAQSFNQYFNVNLALTPEQKQDVYRVRYRVYCEEFGYEPLENFPDKQEYDDFDDRSLHCLITHKSTGRPAGCVRLVSGAEQGDMPFERFCPGTLDQEFLDNLDLDRTTVCEISRLAVDGAFRRRAGEERTRFGGVDAIDCTHQERRTFSMISVAAFLGATALTESTGRRNVFAMMEPFLPRLLKRSGIPFERAGEDIDYHGLRAPYFTRTQEALDGMHEDLRELYDTIAGRIQEQYAESVKDS